MFNHLLSLSPRAAAIPSVRVPREVLAAIRRTTWVACVGLLGIASAIAGDHWTTSAAMPDAAAQPPAITRAFVLVGIAPDFAFDPIGQLEERDDGTATLTGIIASLSQPGIRFSVHLNYSGRILTGEAGYPPAGSPKKELIPSAYIENGGPIDPATWTYYTAGNGFFVGLGAAQGALLQVALDGPAFQVGTGANGKNVLFGASGWIAAKTLSQPSLSGLVFPEIVYGDGNMQLASEARPCAAPADADSTVGGVDGGHAFTFTGGVGSDFVFASPGSFTERSDGTATISGRLVRASNPLQGFFVTLDLGQRVDPGDVGFAPPGSPKQELSPLAYVDNGGPIDPLGWHYYLAVNGTLVGADDFTGAVVAMERVGPALQVGMGANGKNASYGLSSWFKLTTTSQPLAGPVLPETFSGDGNIDLQAECAECVGAADIDRYGVSGGHAFIAPSLGGTFVFAVPATFEEKADGTARLVGVLEQTSNPLQSFEIELTMWNRVGAGDVGFPPVGSPKKELLSAAYVENGGPVDPATWHYYEMFEGTLTGLGNYDGALLDIARLGPSFQVGFGANGKNAGFGASAWFYITTVQQPFMHPTFPNEVVADGNFDLAASCPPVAGVGSIEVIDPGCPGSANYVPELRLLGLPMAGKPIIFRLKHGLGSALSLILAGATDRTTIDGTCTLYVAPPIVAFAVVLPGMGPGGGEVSISTYVPPVAVVRNINLQAAVIDPIAYGGYAMSNGLAVVAVP